MGSCGEAATSSKLLKCSTGWTGPPEAISAGDFGTSPVSLNPSIALLSRGGVTFEDLLTGPDGWYAITTLADVALFEAVSEPPEREATTLPSVDVTATLLDGEVEFPSKRPSPAEVEGVMVKCSITIESRRRRPREAGGGGGGGGGG